MDIGKVKILVSLLLFFPFFAFFRLAHADEMGQGLPLELRHLEIKEHFIESQFDKAGWIREVIGNGKVIVVHRAKQEAYYARIGDPLYENDAIYTLKDCRIRIEFKDRNTAILAPVSHLDIDEIYESVLKGKKKALLGMTKGKGIFYAIQMFRYKEMEFQLKTPTATAGIRGTKFGVEILKGKQTQSRILNRMFASRSLAQAEEKLEDVVTRIYGIEGEVSVTSLMDGRMKHVRDYEIIEADQKGLGDVRSDPEKTKSFVQDVVSGMESTPRLEPGILERDFRREDLNRMERIEDIKQRERLDDKIHDFRGGKNW